MIKNNLGIIIVTILLGSLVFSTSLGSIPIDDNNIASSQVDGPNYTEDEVVGIAMANDEVRFWVEDFDAIWEAIYFDIDQQWLIQFFPNKEELKQWLEVLVDDTTGEIVDIIVVEVSSPYIPENTELQNAAIEYFQKLDLLTNFIVENPDLSWWAYEYEMYEMYDYVCDASDCYQDTTEARIQVEAYDYTNNVYLSAMAFFIEELNGTYSFETSYISSTSQFGSPINDFIQIEALVLELAEVQEYTSAVDDYSLSITLVYIENLGNSSNPNYYLPFELDLGYLYFVQFNQGYSYGYTDEPVTDANQDTGVNEGAPSTDENVPGDVSEPLYPYYNDWLALLVKDNGVVLDIFGPSTALLSDDQITQIILSNDEFSDWLSNVDNYVIYLNFDGYDTWYFSISIPDNYYDYGWGQISDTTGELLDYQIYISIPATQTENGVLAVLEADSEISAWIANSDHYDYWLWYDGYGSWYVYYYDTVFYNNYVYATVDDITLEITDKFVEMLPPPELSERDAVRIFLKNGLRDFLETYENAQVYLSYDGYGSWFVYVYDPVIIEAYYWASLDDASGVIDDRGVNHPDRLPTMSTDAVMAIVDQLSEYQVFKTSGEILFESLYYIDGEWQFYVEALDEDHQYSSLWIRIDDLTGEVLEIGEGYYQYYEGEIALDTNAVPASAESNLSELNSNVNQNQFDDATPYEIDADDLEARDKNNTASNPLPIMSWVAIIPILSGLVLIRRKSIV